MEKNFTVQNLPQAERPRERMIAKGPDALSSQELLALIIGRGVAERSVLDIAQELLSDFGSLKNISMASCEQLCKIKGIGGAKATQIMSCFEICKRLEEHEVQENKNTKIILDSPEKIVKMGRRLLKDKKKEYLICYPIDARNQVIKEEVISLGGLSSSSAHPREVFKQAILLSAASIVLIHNHPSGNPCPSGSDRQLTAQLAEAGSLIGIEVFDHIIIGRNSYYSFRKKGFAIG